MPDPPDLGDPPGAAAGRLSRVLAGLVGAAVVVAAVTALARAVGALRVAVLGQTVGPTCLGDTYATANLVPNVVFEVVAGGALAGLVVPVLAGPLAAGDTATVRRTASALLTWTVLLLVPLALLLAVAARPVMRLLLGEPAAGCDGAEQVALGARMLVVFAPQVVLYGVAVVLGGVLQAHRRFLGPAVAPLLSSVVVIAAYLAYAVQAGPGERPLGEVGTAEELTLSVGTTLGVVALSLPLLLPARRSGVRLAPTLSFPPGVARHAAALAASGSAVLVAQQVSVVVVLRLLNDGAPRGSVVLFTLAMTVFTVPWAVLAVPVATSAFPRLAAQAETGDDEGYAGTLTRAVRAVLLLTALGATALAVVAEPVARVLVLTAPGPASADRLADALVAFAPGLVGYGLVNLLGRALYARRAGRAAAVATSVGWVVVAVADIVLVAALPDEDAVRAVGLGNTLGMTVAGVLLAAAVVRVTRSGGPSSTSGPLAGAGRTALLATAAAAVGFLAGRAVVGLVPEPGVAGSLLTSAAGAAVVVTAFGAVVAAADPRLAAGLARRVSRGRSRGRARGDRAGEDVAP